MSHRGLQFAPQKKYNVLQRDRCSIKKKKEKKRKIPIMRMTQAKNKMSNEI